MTLIFVYNANSGIFNIFKDVTHKLVNRTTYPCSLCAITYDTFKENSTWKAYRKKSKHKFIFLHKDEFEIEFPEIKVSYPIILKTVNHEVTELLTTIELDEIESVEDLISKIEARV